MKKPIITFFVLIITILSGLFSLGHSRTSLQPTAYLTYIHHPQEAEILKKFCSRKSENAKRNYLQYLANIIKIGPTYKKQVNFNREDERIEKHNNALNLKSYTSKNNPHIEAAFQLGIIFGFSWCGFQDFDLAVESFENAHIKPDTQFAIAELYRRTKPTGNYQRITKFYNNAILLNNPAAYYNKALLDLEVANQQKQPLNSKKIAIILQNLKKASQNNIIPALNDYAILMLYFQKNLSYTQKNNLIKNYIERAAQNRFQTAIRNIIILNLKNHCETEASRKISYYLKLLTDQKLKSQIIEFKTHPPCSPKKFLRTKHQSTEKQKDLVETTRRLAMIAMKDYNRVIEKIR